MSDPAATLHFELLCLPFTVFRGRSTGSCIWITGYSLSNFEVYNKSVLADMAVSIGKYIGRVMDFERRIEKRMSVGVEQSPAAGSSFEIHIVAESMIMRELIKQTDIAARTGAPVLILGETGVGKELLAKRIHFMSSQKKASFVDINLAAIPETLMESELFGYEKGAFTGADRQKKGHVELADKGTLFMDEVGDIPKAIQVKLLRLIQEKSFYRVGGIRKITSDFRLITATNHDLKKQIDLGHFREDLYYRLNVIQLYLPPLRERGNDIIALARHFLDKVSQRYFFSVPELSETDRKRLLVYPWPGNVRELENVIERAVIMAGGDPALFKIAQLVSPGDTVLSRENGFSITNNSTLDEMQRRYIEHVLIKTGGKLSGPGGATEILGMKRQTLYHRMKNLGIK